MLRNFKDFNTDMTEIILEKHVFPFILFNKVFYNRDIYK